MSEIWKIWMSGGWVMLGLFGLAVLLYAQAFQLVMYVRRTDLNKKNELQWWDHTLEPGLRGWSRSRLLALSKAASSIL